MHRFLASWLLLALATTLGGKSSLHTHLYRDHDHHDHHHGLALHRHGAAVPLPEDGAPHFQDCDPARHAVSFVVTSAVLPILEIVDGEVDAPPVLVHVHGAAPMVRDADVRVHGPPPGTAASPRAPPLALA